jgi:hypothetical protein
MSKMKWKDYDVRVLVEKEHYVERSVIGVRAVSRKHAMDKALKMRPDAYEVEIEEYNGSSGNQHAELQS